MNFILNLLWLFLGGWTAALSWFFSAIIMVLTIVGIPWARAAFNIGVLTLWPFGSKVVDRSRLTGSMDLGTSPLGFIGNILWFVFAGWWLALVHLFWALVFFITIIGIPFALQHVKLARISLMPVGKAVKFEWIGK
ncbi:MAG: YccF domain-containing protein [Pseudobdellovibrionaceae bacterium]